MTGPDFLFGLASAAAVASSLLAVRARNPVYSAVWMMGSLFSVAVIYLLLHSTFLFVIQALLYAGAILVLFVFVIMLLNPAREDLELDRPPAWMTGMAAGFAAVLFIVLARAVATDEVARVPGFAAENAAPVREANFGTVAWFGETVYVKYLVPFEMISVLIMAAIAAVLLLAKRHLEPAGEESER